MALTIGAAFLRKAAALIVDYENEDRIRSVLYNYILAGNYSGPLFLKSIVITETLLAIKKDLSMDYKIGRAHV